MADKALSDATWKAFAKGKGYKDAVLLKALEQLDSVDDEPAAAQLSALTAVEAAFDALRKAHKADKALATHLVTVDKALLQAHKQVEQTAEEERKAAALEAALRNPPLMTKKMVPLLRQVRKGETMHALVATAGRPAAVLLSKREIAPARRKMLMLYLGETSGVKFYKGECLWKQNALTFVLGSAPSGLGKKLKLAVLEQCGLRMNVSVSGDDEGSTGE